jgi:hypothetical protein
MPSGKEFSHFVPDKFKFRRYNSIVACLRQAGLLGNGLSFKGEEDGLFP